MALFILKITIHPAQKAQIAMLLAKKITVPVRYTNFTNVFSGELTELLSKRTSNNIYAIKLVFCKKPPYRPIYSLSLVKPQILKIYTKTNLANSFIWPLKSLADTLIIFI